MPKRNLAFWFTEAATIKKVFLDISQNSQVSNCARVFFLIKLQAPVNFGKFLRTSISQNTSGRLLLDLLLYTTVPTLYSCLWKLSLLFIYIFKAAWNLLIKFWNSVQSLNRNILTVSYFKMETSVEITITSCNMLFTNFLTWYKVENYIGDTPW